MVYSETLHYSSQEVLVGEPFGERVPGEECLNWMMGKMTAGAQMDPNCESNCEVFSNLGSPINLTFQH